MSKQKHPLDTLEERAQELRALVTAFEKHKERLDRQWVKECVGALSLLLDEADTATEMANLLAVYSAAMWQKGFKSALEFVLPEGEP